MPSIVHGLLTPGTELIETHISWVFLRGEHVWKVKKPVNLGFLDFSCLEKRRRACEAEVQLNARLAPNVYLGVRPITKDAAGALALEGGGEVVEWAVEMKRLPDARRADLLLQRGELQAADVDALAARVAAFHRASPADEALQAFGSCDAILGNVLENFEQTEASVRTYLSDADARQLQHEQRVFVEGHRELFEERVATGRVRDGHGDLRLEHVYLLEDGPVIIDCIEFNERFRYADVCADIAFLAMDLERLGRVDLAERLLASYARASGDYQLYLLVDFYEGYRAYVRAKVASVLARDTDASPEARSRAHEEARLYYLLSLSAGREYLLKPAVIAVGGIIGAGKSTLAALISTLTGAPSIDADGTRKFLLGVANTQRLSERAWAGAYAPELTDEVYDELFARAELVLRSGRPIVLDASFRSRKHRQRAVALAERHDVPFWMVEASASPELCRARLQERVKGPSVSDGRPEIYDDFVAGFEPMDELEPSRHVVVDTGRPLSESEQSLRAVLPCWPSGLNR